MLGAIALVYLQPRAVILLLYKDVKTDPAKSLPIFTISLSENILLSVPCAPKVVY